MVTPFISVVIVTWNSEQSIQPCLDSLRRQSWRNFEVIVVDNHSVDKTLEWVRQYPCVVKQIAQNVGFCEAVNEGWRLARGEFLLALNPDVRLDPKCLEILADAVKKLPENVGMFAPKLLDREGKRIDSAGLKLSFLRRFYNRGCGEVDQGQYDRRSEILGPCGAAALYSRKMLEAVNPKGEVFDPLFFAYGEDFDLSWRGRQKQFKAALVPAAVGFHNGGSSIPPISPQKKQYLSWRNRYFLILKNESLAGFLLRLPAMLFYDLPRVVYFLAANPYRWQGVREVITQAPSLLRKR